MQIKASHNAIERVAENMRGEIVTVRQLAEQQRSYAALYVQQLRYLSGAFQVHILLDQGKVGSKAREGRYSSS